MLSVTPSGKVDILVNANAALPKRDKRRRSRVLDEYTRRRGDPTPGGSTRVPIMTAYRQGALHCAVAMAEGPKRPRDLTWITPKAQALLHRNVYGWFARVDRGLYRLSDLGREAIEKVPGTSTVQSAEP